MEPETLATKMDTLVYSPSVRTPIESPQKFIMHTPDESPQRFATANALAIRQETVEKAMDSILGSSPSPSK